MAIALQFSTRIFRAMALPILVAAMASTAGTIALSSAKGDTPQPGRPIGSFAPILEKVIPAVVTVRITGETLKPVEFLPRRDGQETAVAEKETFRSGGSGVIVDASHGYILTNNHVIENASRIEVGLSDGRRMLAKLIGRDIGTDVAVIKVEEPNLPSVAVGNSDQMRVGDVIMAVGNPFGLEGTATLGIVSALMRTEVGHEAFEDFMQIDAQINPGNSGGALVDIKGELVGINTAVAGGPDRNVGIGFAIPINMAKVVKSELIAHGRMRRGSLGLVVEDLAPEAAPVSMIGPKRGAVITRVVAGSPGEKAGLKAGDIVVGLGAKPVRGAAEYSTRVVTLPIDMPVLLTIFVEGQKTQRSLQVTEMVTVPVEHTVSRDAGSISGAALGDILPGNPLYGDVRGTQVLKVPADSAADRAGFHEGDVIVGVDGMSVRSTDDFLRVLDRTGMQYRVRLVRSGTPGWIRGTR
jgi:Do/DeqQ family serine protease